VDTTELCRTRSGAPAAPVEADPGEGVAGEPPRRLVMPEQDALACLAQPARAEDPAEIAARITALRASVARQQRQAR